MMVNDTIYLEEGTKSSLVSIIRSSIEAINYTWLKDEVEIHEHERHLFSEKGVTFNNVERDDIGNYSLTAHMSCHEHLKPRKFVGNFLLNVICKYHVLVYELLCKTIMIIQMVLNWLKQIKCTLLTMETQ